MISQRRNKCWNKHLEKAFNETTVLLNMTMNLQHILKTEAVPHRCSSNTSSVKMQQNFHENPCRSVVSITSLWNLNYNQTTTWHGCCPVNLLHICKTLFLKNNSGEVRLKRKWFFKYNQQFIECTKYRKTQSDVKHFKILPRTYFGLEWFKDLPMFFSI